MRFIDGLRSFTSALTNRRRAAQTNYFEATRLSDRDLRAVYASGIGNKIVRLKITTALRDTLQFDSVADQEYYDKHLSRSVRRAAQWMLAFGRGILVLHHRGDDLRKPLGDVDRDKALVSVFSGDMITVAKAELDLQSPRYYLPVEYIVRGQPVHHSRVVDFRYVPPPELEAPLYHYGGISEFELIYEQLVADGVVQRACPQIIDKASTMYYKVVGFKDAMQVGKEGDMVRYFQALEDLRGIFSAGLIDAEDTIEAVQQNISNLADADTITLRRLALVTGIPLTILADESATGLNATGENEMQLYQHLLQNVQDEFLYDPINELGRLLKMGPIWFKDNQGETPGVRIDYETKAIANAMNLAQLGEDYAGYLRDKGVVAQDDFAAVFPDAT